MDYQQIYDNSVKIFLDRLPLNFDENNTEHLLLLETCIMEIMTKSMESANRGEEFEDIKNQTLSTINLAFQIGFKETRQHVGIVELSQEEILKITEQIKTHFHKAFWDKLTEDLNQKPVKVDQLIVLFSEILERLDKLTPNNLTYKHENHDRLSAKILESQIKNGVFRPEYLDGIVDFIISERLRKFISPADDQDFQEWTEQLYKILQQSTDISVAVPLIFQGIYRWLDRIEQQIREFNLQFKENFPHLFR